MWPVTSTNQMSELKANKTTQKVRVRGLVVMVMVTMVMLVSLVMLVVMLVSLVMVAWLMLLADGKEWHCQMVASEGEPGQGWMARVISHHTHYSDTCVLPFFSHPFICNSFFKTKFLAVCKHVTWYSCHYWDFYITHRSEYKLYRIIWKFIIYN